jgi:hypothetical protein
MVLSELALQPIMVSNRISASSRNRSSVVRDVAIHCTDGALPNRAYVRRNCQSKPLEFELNTCLLFHSGVDRTLVM